MSPSYAFDVLTRTFEYAALQYLGREFPDTTDVSLLTQGMSRSQCTGRGLQFTLLRDVSNQGAL